MISLDEFMATEKPKRRSKLEPFKNDILTLKNEGYSEASIVKYLAMNNITVSQRTVNIFIHKNRETQIIATSETKMDKSQNEGKKAISSVPAPRKFDWQSPVDGSEII